MSAESVGERTMDHRAGFSRGIDFCRLERETRPYLIAGIVCGIVLGAVLSRCGFHSTISAPLVAGESERPLIVRLIEIPRSPSPSPHTTTPSPTISPLVERTPVTSHSDTMRQDVRFPGKGPDPGGSSRTAVPEMSERAPALGDTAAMGRLQRLHRKVTIEEREREMAALKNKYGKDGANRPRTVFEAEKSPASKGMVRFGIPFSVSNPFAKKPKPPRRASRVALAPDSLRGGTGVTPEQALLERLRADDFRSLSEPDVRFLILMWRDTYFDESRLSLSDWAFLTRSGLGGHFTSAAYLKSMEERGLVKKAVMSGGVYYCTQLSREELLKALERNSTQFVNSPRSAEWLSLVSLVGSCYDFTRHRVIIPE